MINTFIECVRSKEISPILNWYNGMGMEPLSESEEVHVCDLMIVNKRAFIIADGDGNLKCGSYAPKGYTEILPEYALRLVLTNYETVHETVVLNGKTYYKAELEEALRGCEVL